MKYILQRTEGGHTRSSKHAGGYADYTTINLHIFVFLGFGSRNTIVTYLAQHDVPFMSIKFKYSSFPLMNHTSF